jgi:hypothetical protein
MQAQWETEAFEKQDASVRLVCNTAYMNYPGNELSPRVVHVGSA